MAVIWIDTQHRQEMASACTVMGLTKTVECQRVLKRLMLRGYRKDQSNVNYRLPRKWLLGWACTG